MLPALIISLVVYAISRSEPDLDALESVWQVTGWARAGPLLVGLAKRLHDAGHSGLWALTAVVPIVGVVSFLLIAFVLPGQSDTNKYGAPPLDLVGAR